MQSTSIQARPWQLIAFAWSAGLVMGVVDAIEALELHHDVTFCVASAFIGGALANIMIAVRTLSCLKRSTNFETGGRRVGWTRRSEQDDHRGADPGPEQTADADGGPKRADDTCAGEGAGAGEGASVTIEAPTAPDLTTCVLGFREWAFSYVLDPDAPAPRTVHHGGIVTEEVAPTYYVVDGQRVPTLLGSSQQHWHAGVNRARCHAHLHYGYLHATISVTPAAPPAPHLPPGGDCGCGLYGLHDGEAFIAKGHSGNSILGAIAAWGRMEVHRDGFRAEFARVLMLAYDPAHGIAIEHRVRNVAEAYGVPCVPIDDLPKAALEHAQPIPVEMRGPTEVTSHAGGATRLAELESR